MSDTRLKRIAVFVSGQGTNLQSLIEATQTGDLTAEIVLVVSNRKAAYGLVRAEEAGIPTLYAPLKPYRDAGRSREAYDADLASKVKDYRPDLIVLAGWMHIFSPYFLDHFPQQVLNLHPSLPDQYVGRHGIEWAYEAFQTGEISETGVMVHWVIPEVDAGPVILAREVPILPSDSLADLATRIHQAEQQVLLEAVQSELTKF